MKEQIVGFEVAKLAKDKGFDWLCKYAYDINKKLFHDSHCNTNWNDKVFLISECSAPTQALLQKWLREKHKINCKVASNSLICHFPMNEILEEYGTELCGPKRFILFDTYEKALEAGLLAALQLIKNEK